MYVLELTQGRWEDGNSSTSSRDETAVTLR